MAKLKFTIEVEIDETLVHPDEDMVKTFSKMISDYYHFAALADTEVLSVTVGTSQLYEL